MYMILSYMGKTASCRTYWKENCKFKVKEEKSIGYIFSADKIKPVIEKQLKKYKDPKL